MSSLKTTMAYLREESPFFGLFEGGAVPIQSPIEEKAMLEGEAGDAGQRVYFVDLDSLAPGQLDGVVGILASRSGVDGEVIRAEVLERGLPLRASQVKCVAVDARRFL